MVQKQTIETNEQTTVYIVDYTDIKTGEKIADQNRK
ncbi:MULTISPECIES: DUF1541 domain-containing protein [Bacillaceae]|nr:DUF1541 domain-containing protein [Bacillus rubiinfantis]